jgi:hypothetical protein
VPTFQHEYTSTASQVTPATAIPIKQYISDFPLKREPNSNRHGSALQAYAYPFGHLVRVGVIGGIRTHIHRATAGAP